MGIVCAVLSNIYAGPREAKSGSPARSLEDRAATLGLKTGSTEPYLAWRFSALIFAVITGLVRLVLVWLSISGGSDEYSAFLAEQLPPSVPAERFDNLVRFLQREELAIWTLSALGVLMAIGACCSSTPSVAFSRTQMSRRFIWGSWLVTFLPPFLLFLVFPIRSLVDWDAIVADNCNATLRVTLTTDPSLETNLRRLAQNDLLGLLSADMQALVTTDQYDWCYGVGADWHTKFYGTSLDCLWKAEDFCRGRVCIDPTPPIPARLGECLTQCITFALDDVFAGETRNRAAQLLQNQIEVCTALDEGFTLGRIPNMRRTPSLADPAASVAFYEDMVNVQRLAIVHFAEASTLASLQAEYVVGMLISLIASKYLLPAGLSVLAGLAQAFMNVKVMFLSQQQGAWALILITAQALPLYVALLAVFTQLLGDTTLVAAVVCAALYISVGAHTGKRLLVVGGGEEGIKKLNREHLLDSLLHFLPGLGVVASAVVWAQAKGVGVEQYVRTDIFTPKVLAAGLLDFLARKMVTVVAGTDAVLTGFLGSEDWFSKLSESDRVEHFSKVSDFCAATSVCRARNDVATYVSPAKPETVGGRSMN